MTPQHSRFAPATIKSLVHLLQTRRASTARSAESLRAEATHALSRRDLSDMFDQDDPTADADAASTLLLADQAERRLHEVEQALARIDDGTYGYCSDCGAGIALERLRALPATESCFTCSGRTAQRNPDRVGVHRDTAPSSRNHASSVRSGSGHEVGS